MGHDIYLCNCSYLVFRYHASSTPHRGIIKHSWCYNLFETLCTFFFYWISTSGIHDYSLKVNQLERHWDSGSTSPIKEKERGGKEREKRRREEEERKQWRGEEKRREGDRSRETKVSNKIRNRPGSENAFINGGITLFYVCVCFSGPSVTDVCTQFDHTN